VGGASVTVKPLRSDVIEGLKTALGHLQPAMTFGRVTSYKGGLIRAAGFLENPSVGTLCHIMDESHQAHAAEVMGFEGGEVLLMLFGRVEGVAPGNQVKIIEKTPAIYPHSSWLGRVINGFGQPLDHRFLGPGTTPYFLNADPLPAHERARITQRLDLGVRVLNTFTTCCRGQRLGIFAGSGVGKSVLLSQIARFSNADVIVIGLIGERGREVREFIENSLGPQGLARSVLIVATSDESAPMRRRAAMATLSVAEYFRDQGAQVLCVIDSVTRFAMALREIGLSLGQPPTTKGYTPNVFAELPRLLERAGPGLETDQRSDSPGITGLFTVLVEGDDHNEPVSDTVRGILDGHIVLERRIAERGIFPAVNVLRSISRTMPQCNTPPETTLIQFARRALALYEDMEELIRLGAYRKGSNKEVDQAIIVYEALLPFLKQDIATTNTYEEGFAQLQEVLTPLMESP
jgi:flagellum-specific ATP synthase